MQSMSHTISRCALAQSYLDGLHRNSSSISVDSDIESDLSIARDDRNTDLDERYRELAQANGPQRNHRREMMGDTGGSRLKPGMMTDNAHYARLKNELRESQQHYRLEQHYQHQPHHHHKQLSQQQQPPYHSSADQNLTKDRLQPWLQQSDQLPMHHRYPPPAISEDGAYHHNGTQTDNGRRHHRYSQAEMSLLGSMIPPLHRSMDQVTTSTIKSPLPCNNIVEPMQNQQEPMQQKPLASTGIVSRLLKQPHLLPPPILIPKDTPQQHQQLAVQSMASMMHKQKQQQQQQQQLPSPIHSASSPESPSGLAIHLYVHHHHHHHAQEPSPPLSATSSLSIQDSTACTNAPSGAVQAPHQQQQLLLLSPLTLPLISPPLEPESNAPSTYSHIGSLPSPPSPTPEVIPVSGHQLAAQPHHPLVSLLPSSLHLQGSAIEKNHHGLQLTASNPVPPSTSCINTDPSAALPWFSNTDGLSYSNVPLSSPASSSPISQFSSPATLPLPAATAASAPAVATAPSINSSTIRLHSPPEPHPRRNAQAHRHINRHRASQHSSQLPNAALATQLLSTISSQDLARLYVHAAHHLHSHQPIYRYVLMKMIMTQAELAQYGRLRAEMPRAPGPSTGAMPKRTGFGSAANTGLASQPKVKSKLGQFVVVAVETNREREQERSWAKMIRLRPQQQQSQYHHHHHRHLSSLSAAAELPVDCPTSTVLKAKRLSLPWTKSLPSLAASFTNTLSKRRSRYSEPDLYSAKTLEELELGEKQGQEHLVQIDCRRMSKPTGAISMGQNGRRTLGGGGVRRMLGTEDDGDVESEEFCGDEEEDDDDDDLDTDEFEDGEEEEEVQLEKTSYWSLLRGKSSRRRRLVSRSLEPDKEPQRHLHYHHQFENPSFSSAVSPISMIDAVGKSSPSDKFKNARRRAGVSLRMASSQSSHSISDSLPSTIGDASSATPYSGSYFTESYGFSGLLMLSLFAFFLILLEGTNQIYNLQSALLSIIL